MMVNNVTFTGVQKHVQDFMTAAAHEYMPTGKIFNKAEAKVAEEAAEAAAKVAAKAEEVPFFNHRGNNIIDTTVAQLQDLEAAQSYARSHGVQIAEELAESTLKTNA